MSGENTVTAGASLASTSDPLTRTKANLLGTPTVRANESSVTHREMAVGAEVLLASLIGADMNSTADQSVDMPSGDYTIGEILVTNASISLDTAVGGIYTGAGKTGGIVVAATQAYSNLTASTKKDELTLTSTCTTDVFSDDPIYVSLTTAQGAAATADFYFYGKYLK